MINETVHTVQEYDGKYTFWKLLSQYIIEIPIIQRDYAQGRNSENASAIRKELLDSIYDSLVYDIPLDFDFVYGSIEDDKLFPLDGQQRLTTFFLLHWYLSEKEGRIDETRDVLERFSYTTRISSRDFCHMLVNLDYEPEKNVPTSKFIKNENKYFHSWDNDPTIRAMLVMLDDIHSKFFECEPLLDKLLDEDGALITFNYLPMEHYSLTDDLYIKMNARGKALSAFENFKAKFIQHLRDNGLPYDHFEECIDSKWTDLLWDYRSRNNTVDRQFMNLFCYFTEMIFLWCESQQECESPFKSSDVRKIVSYYDSEEKVNLLYSLMDLWSGKAEAQEYLEGILCTKRTEGKVCVFDGNADIFSDIIEGVGVTLPNRILLFSIMRRLINLGKDTDNEAMLDYARIVRNFLIKNRFFSKTKCVFSPDFRFGRNGIPYTAFIGTYLTNSESPYEVIRENYSGDYEGINVEIYKQESRKAEIILEHPELKALIHGLEDLTIFRGSIFNILDYAVECNDEYLIDNLNGLFTPKNSNAIIPALLSVGDYGINVGGTVLGDKYFYGNKDRWYEIMTYSGGEKYRNIITEFVHQYQEDEADMIEDTLENISQNNLKLIDINDWRYCLIKYPSTLQEYNEVNNRNLIFAFDGNSDCFLLHRMNGRTLNSYHVVPEYIEVANQLGNDCYKGVCGKNTDDLGGIYLSCHHNMSISLNNDNGICITHEDNPTEENFALKAIERYEQINTKGMDRVERLLIMAKVIKDMS